MSQKIKMLSEMLPYSYGIRFPGGKYHIIFDNLFVTTRLIKVLLERKTYACRIVWAGRKDWSSEFRKLEDL
jgi:hypothetical protein